MFDNQGLPLTVENKEAADAFNRAVTELFDYRLSAMPTLKGALAIDPDFCMAECLRGYMLMMFNSASVHSSARGALTAAEAAAPCATLREQAHVAALKALVDGDHRAACARWEAILAEHPLDLVALRLHHYTSFWSGFRQNLSTGPAAVLAAWSPDIANYGNVLGMLAFGLEELGEYETAERYGREGAELNPDDLWSIHAVAHVMEMQQRVDEGIDWLDYPLDQWADRNPFRGHLWWHRGLFQIEADRLDESLALYDSSIYDTQSEFFMDVHNAVSFLARLEFRGMDVGDRWEVLADIAAKNTDGHAMVFTDLHHVIALARCGRFDQARAHIQSMRNRAAQDDTHVAQVLTRAGIPVSEGLLAFGEGDSIRALDTLTYSRPRLAEVGASNAQRDLFALITIEAAKRGDDGAKLTLLTHERDFARGLARA